MGERKRYLELWVPLEVGPAIPAPPIEPYSGLIGENIKVCSGITGAEIEIRLVSAALKVTSQILPELTSSVWTPSREYWGGYKRPGQGTEVEDKKKPTEEYTSEEQDEKDVVESV